MKKTAIFSLLTGIWVSSGAVFAETLKTVSQGASAEEIPLDNVLSQGTIYQGGMLRAVISLFIVIGLIYFTAWIYKRLNLFNSENIAKTDKKVNANKFKLVSTQALGANKNLHVVEINGKYLVIGSTQNSISLIKEFDKNLVENLSDTAVTSSVQQVKNKETQEEPSEEAKNFIEDPQLDELLKKYKEL